MPTVPTYTPQVQQRVAQTPEATPDEFGAVQGEEEQRAGGALTSLGGDVISDAAREQLQLDRAQVRDALSSAESDTYDYVTDNVLSKKGKDAIGLLPQAQQDMTAIQSKYSDGLSNPAQQRMFNQLYPQVYNRASNMSRRHILQQQQAYNQQTLTASKATAVSVATTDYNDPNNISAAEQTIAADNNSIYHGSPQEGAEATASETSKLHSGVVSAMAANNPAQAAVYLRANQAKIDPQEFDKLKKTVDTQVLTDGANKTVSTLTSLDPATATAEADKIQDPQQRQLVMDSLQTHFAAKNAAASLSSANQDALNLQTVLGDPENAAINLPNTIDPATRSSLIQAANDRVQASQGGSPIQTNLPVYSSLIKQAANDPDGFLRRPLTGYASQLSDNDWHDVLNLRDSLAKARQEALKTATSKDALNQTFNEAIKGVPALSMYDDQNKPLKPGGPAEARVAQINAFRSDFQNRLSQQFPDGKDQTPDNAKTILDKMLVSRAVDKGWLWGTTGSVPQGVVDENPSATHINSGFSKTLEPVKQNNGQTVYYDYNDARTSADVYDGTGKKIGQWPTTR